MTVSYNQMGVIKNPYQGKFKKVLCVCSAGCLRSPTAAVVLSQEPYNFNTRAAGITTEYAIVPVTDALCLWADEIVCMEPWQKTSLMVNYEVPEDKIVCLNIEDSFAYRNQKLMDLIRENYDAAV